MREIWLIDAQHRQFEVHALNGDSYSSPVLATGRWTSDVLPGLPVDAEWF